MPEERDLLCGGWAWDAVLRELRHYPRRKKGWADEPDGVERLKPVASVTLHRWAQQPMASHTGEMMTPRRARVVAAFDGGGNIEINEDDRECAEKLARALAETYRLPVIEGGAPDGRRGGNVPQRDQMRRLVNRRGKAEVILDEMGGEIIVAKSRFPAGKTRKRYRTSEVRRLELTYEVKGAYETFSVDAMVGPDEERISLAAHTWYEGWADPGEWLEFAQDLARSLGVEVVLP